MVTYLKQLPVTQIKIDQSFVRGMLDHPDDLAILEGVIGLASAFRRQVIAEGIETVAQGEMLIRLGCELAQGFGISRPMPANEIPKWSSLWRPDPAWINCRPACREALPLIFAGVEHSAWIVALENYIKGVSDIPPPLDQHLCRFGMWLETDGLAHLGSHPAFQAIKPLHRWVHAQAMDMCELHVQGRHAEVLARFGALHGLRDALLEQLKSVVQGLDRK